MQGLCEALANLKVKLVILLLTSMPGYTGHPYLLVKKVTKKHPTGGGAPRPSGPIFVWFLKPDTTSTTGSRQLLVADVSGGSRGEGRRPAPPWAAQRNAFMVKGPLKGPGCT